MQAFWQRVAEILRLNRLGRRWQKAARVLAVVVVFCTTYMLILPAITMEKETFCGIEDHIHTDECYISLSAELGPDGETPDIWEATLSGIEFTDSASENILAVARSQIGYTESELNYELDENGEKQHYTRYGQWYGNPYGNWNAMFASFCIYYGRAEIADSLTSSGISGMRYQWEQAELFAQAESHEAKKGELIFIDTTADGEADHIGIISEVSQTGLTVILGDWENSVQEVSLDNMSVVLGYGLTENLTVKEITEEETTEEETTAEETTEEEITEEETTAEETTEEETTTEETTQQETTTEEATEEETTQEVSRESTTDKIAESEHIHSDECYTSDSILACTEWGKIEPWGLDWSSDEFHDKAVKYVTYLINQLPNIDEFESILNEYDANEDYEGYEKYYKEVYKIVSKAYVNYENLLLDLRNLVPNREHLFNYEWLYSGISNMAVTDSKTVHFVNYYDEATADRVVLVHNQSVDEASTFGFYWWYAVVVEENEYGELIVIEKYSTKTNKGSLEAAGPRGFVLISHGGSGDFACSIGDEVTVNFDYLNTTGSSITNGFGTVTFSEYVPPEPEEPDPTTEDLPFTPDEPSDSQVVYHGATVTSGNQDVEISKSIDGTDIENVFDITLSVKTKTNVQTFFEDPDMAVVVVMDISNTMNSAYPSGSSTSRYDAAVAAAENFINQYAGISKGLSEIGFVAFNTHAEEILKMQTITSNNASTLIQTMKDETYEIVSTYEHDSKNNPTDPDRFTNVEGGLKMGYDMLRSSDNENKYIIFLSDGFPTTYLIDNSDENTTNYQGYYTETTSGTPGTDGVFYDDVLNVYCTGGTSYSDKAAIRAREMATKIKSTGAKIFSIGIDIGGQTVQTYVDMAWSTGSVVDRTSTTYEIGDAKSQDAYKTWLGSSIGSNTAEDTEHQYYHDSTNQEQITNAFSLIFNEILALNKETKRTVWTATDPLPVLDENAQVVEFISFFNKDGDMYKDAEAKETYQSLDGVFELYGEDEASHEDGIIYWDLKQSGYTEETDPNDENTKYYTYSVKYRVRLYNENSGFVENQVYETNGDAYLEYRTITYDDKGNTDISDKKTLYFPKPSVKGYLSEFTFTKVNGMGNALEGAVFTLSHDEGSCPICHGDGTSVTSVSTLGPFESASDGTVTFTNIPSGHKYILAETKAPEGYMITDKTYGVTIAYDEISFTGDWDGTTISNPAIGHILPETGGTGIYYMYIIGGLLIALSSVFLLCLYKKKKDRERRMNC